jgi:hypothetical protein
VAVPFLFFILLFMGAKGKLCGTKLQAIDYKLLNLKPESDPTGTGLR